MISAICLGAVFHAGDPDRQGRELVEEHSVVAHAQTEFIARRSELLHVAFAKRQEIIDGVQNVKRGGPVDGAELRLGFRCPDDAFLASLTGGA